MGSPSVRQKGLSSCLESEDPDHLSPDQGDPLTTSPHPRDQFTEHGPSVSLKVGTGRDLKLFNPQESQTGKQRSPKGPCPGHKGRCVTSGTQELLGFRTPHQPSTSSGPSPCSLRPTGLAAAKKALWGLRLAPPPPAGAAPEPPTLLPAHRRALPPAQPPTHHASQGAGSQGCRHPAECWPGVAGTCRRGGCPRISHSRRRSPRRRCPPCRSEKKRGASDALEGGGVIPTQQQRRGCWENTPKVPWENQRMGCSCLEKCWVQRTGLWSQCVGRWLRHWPPEVPWPLCTSAFTTIK